MSSPAPSPTGPLLAYGSEHPSDLLDNAACVIRFLADMSVGEENLALDDRSAHGLFLILQAVENTITTARDKL